MKVKITDNHYEVGKKKYDRVTRILNVIKINTSSYFDRMSDDRKDDMLESAADIGKEFHNITSLMEIGKIDQENHPMMLGLKQRNRILYLMAQRYFSWKKNTVEKVIASELIVTDDKFMYGGSLDSLVVLKGEKLPTLIEKKTSSKIYPTVRLQSAAYMKSETAKKYGIKRRLVIHIDRTGRFHKPVEYFNDKEDFDLFKCALQLYRNLK